tara:strand:- start:588 stop:1001 length:414 start_codon:yes stop_codon:yes gene_type:complete
LNKKISNKDREDWKKFIESDDKLVNKDNEFFKKQKRQEKTLDLHGYSLPDANRTLETFINEAFDNNVSKIRVITGKGLHSQNEKDPYVSKEFGILKNSIPEFLNNNRNLMKKIYKTESASIEDGGSGALILYLKNKK